MGTELPRALKDCIVNHFVENKKGILLEKNCMPLPARFQKPQARQQSKPSEGVAIILVGDGFDGVVTHTVRTQGGVIVGSSDWVDLLTSSRLKVPQDAATLGALSSCIVDIKTKFAVDALSDGCTYLFDRDAAIELVGEIDGGATTATPNEVAFAFSEVMLEHRPSDPRIPEQPVRLERAIAALRGNKLTGPYIGDCVIPSRCITADEVLRAHGERTFFQSYLNDDAATLASTLPSGLRTDVYECAATKVAARTAAAAAVDAAIHVWSAFESDRMPRSAFCLIRPPGHHCSSEPSGFCIINNVVVAARALQHHARTASGGMKPRIAIIDVDVHHGEGTQSLVESDADILLLSMHRYDGGHFYPFGDAGHSSHVGPHGTVVNVPFDTKAGDARHCYAVISDDCFVETWNTVFEKELTSFRPDVVLVSLGFDAALGDPLGKMAVENGFAMLLSNLLAWSSRTPGCRGVVCVLEGGYDASAVAARCVECVSTLLWYGTALERQRVPLVPKTWSTLREKFEKNSQHSSSGVGGTEAAQDDGVVSPDSVLYPLHKEWIVSTLRDVAVQRQTALRLILPAQ